MIGRKKGKVLATSAVPIIGTPRCASESIAAASNTATLVGVCAKVTSPRAVGMVTSFAKVLLVNVAASVSVKRAFLNMKRILLVITENYSQ